ERSTRIGPSSDPSAETQSGGLTLPDILIMWAASWALPAAVGSTFHGYSWWLVPVFLVALPVALYWWWYSKQLMSFILFRVLTSDSPATAVIMPVFLVHMLVIVAAQYLLYRVARAVLVAITAGS